MIRLMDLLNGTKGWRKYIVMVAATLLLVLGVIDQETYAIIIGTGLVGTGIAANGRHKAEGR